MQEPLISLSLKHNPLNHTYLFNNTLHLLAYHLLLGYCRQPLALNPQTTSMINYNNMISYPSLPPNPSLDDWLTSPWSQKALKIMANNTTEHWPQESFLMVKVDFMEVASYTFYLIKHAMVCYFIDHSPLLV